MPGVDEFDWITRLRPLTRGAAEALDLKDDAAVLPSRSAYDQVITKDAMVEGVHFLVGEDRGIVARRLLRTNLSDLAAKGAEPFGYFLMTAWPADDDWASREAFIAGLAEDGETFDLALLGGDTVSTPGPLTVSATMVGYVPSGTTLTRSGAQPDDLVWVSGPIGDGWLGLLTAKGEWQDPTGALAARYRLPTPRLDLRTVLRGHAQAAADISDGLFADALHIAEVSGCGVEIDLGAMPLSDGARLWVEAGGELAQLASGGDDYEIVCAVAPDDADRLIESVGGALVGRFVAGRGLRALMNGTEVAAERLGWRHG